MPLDLQPLRDATVRLGQARASLRYHSQYLVPDLSLLGFLQDVEENARTVEVLALSDAGHRAFPNARASFEASQLALLLCTDPDYKLAGARAWVYYLIQDRRFGELHPESFADAAGGIAPAERYNTAVDEIADVWESFWPGGAGFVRKAAELVENQPRRPDNFLALSVAPTLRERMRSLAEQQGLEARARDEAAIYNRTYAALNREVHPRTRLRPETIIRKSTGEIEFVFEQLDKVDAAQNAVVLAAAACLQALAAVNARTRLAAT